MIIAIGGISNAGKSNLAKRLSDHYRNQSSIVLCQDDFANPTNEIPKIKGHTNWEIPESLDFDKFYKKIIESADSFKIVLVEGLFVYYEERLLNLYDKSIYMSISKETFIKRKRKDLRWGKEPEWYLQHIWESHFLFCKEIDSRNDAFQFSGEVPIDFSSVINFLEI